MTDSLPENLLAERLPDWYRAVSINLDGEHLETRRQIIEALAGEIDFETAEAAVAYAHARKARGSELIDALRETAREHDPSFAADWKDNEPQVMIGAAIAHRLVTEPRSKLSTVLGLLVLNAEFRGFKPAIQGQKLGQLALRQLQIAGEIARKPSSRSGAISTGVAKRFKGLAEFPDDANPAPNSQVGSWTSASKNSIEALAKRLDLIEVSTLADHQLLREQLDQTVWLLEETSGCANSAWSDIASDVVPLLAARELFDISRNSGTPGVDVLLSSTIFKAGQDPGAAIDVLKGVQRSAKFIGELPEGTTGELFPIGTAFDAYREMHGRKGWRELAKTHRGGGNLKSSTAFEASGQFFRELFAARLLQE